MPYPGTTTTLLAYASCTAASSAVIGTATRSFPAPTAGAVPPSDPNAPNSTFPNERFIALLINIDRKNPEAPSSAPDTMSTLFEIAKPVAAEASPEYELRRATDRKSVV